jgi:hypothetical protein
MPQPASETPRWKMRLLLLVLVGGWIVGAPAYRQVFKGRSTWFPRWVMFHGFGRNICDVQFFQTDDGGLTLRPVNRFEILERERSWSTNKSLVRMDSPSAVRSVARRLCRSLGDEPDVRAIARCGSRATWKSKIKPTEKLCVAAPLRGASNGHKVKR